jgi:VWFA-related protein
MNRNRIIITLLSISLVVTTTIAQDPRPASDEVIRITTELVQTGVVVVDKQGKFVDGLKPEEFVLKVDGRQVTPAFFERVVAGTVREEKLEGSIAKGATAPPPSTGVSYKGRNIVFFIDDLHLSAISVQRTRNAILEFVENDMSLEDQVAIATPSGQIGFLQRFSDLKPVVRAAVGRLNHKPYTVRDVEQIPMTEYQALRIEQGDQSATDYYAMELIKANNVRVVGGIGPPNGGPAASTRDTSNRRTTGMTAESAARVVKDRASLLMRQSESVTTGTLSALESVMRSLSQMSGRKLVFLISDGFFLNDKSTGFSNKINRITDAAVRGNLVIYSVDARGLVGSTDASSNRHDAMGQLSRANVGELQASQDGMNALAVDTGGKAFFNMGALTPAINDALRETANYYLLAWRPSSEDQKSANFKRIEISIPGRPELSVRMPRGFFSSEPKTEDKPAETNTAIAETPETANASKNVGNTLMSALAAPSARTGLPTKLFVSFVDVPGSGPVLTAATQMATDALGYGADGKQAAAIDLAGVVLNDQGKQAGSFKTRLNVSPLSSSAATKDPSVVYSHKIPLKPGIYQIRVAARDDKSGSVGSAAQWIEIPDLSSKRLTLSTLLLGGHISNAVQDQKAGGDQVLFSVDRRFARESQLTFFAIIYNASTSAAPKLESQIEIQRGGQRIVASPMMPVVIEPNTDLARIPYGANVGLKTLAPGRYVLKVTVTDRNANAKAVNQIIFDVVE